MLSGGPSPRTEVIHQVSNAYFTEGIVVMQMGDMKLMQATKGPSKGVGDDRIIAWPKPGPGPVAYGQSGGLTEGGIGACRVGASKVKGGQNRKCMINGCRAPTALPAPPDSLCRSARAAIAGSAFDAAAAVHCRALTGPRRRSVQRDGRSIREHQPPWSRARHAGLQGNRGAHRSASPAGRGCSAARLAILRGGRPGAAGGRRGQGRLFREGSG